jgi:hypothetical protein
MELTKKETQTLNNFLENYTPDVKTINNICFNCRFYAGRGKCTAFPKEIPDDIFSGDFKHNKVHPKQENTIIFEPIND